MKFVLVALSVVLLYAMQVSGAGCPCGWVLYDGKCYYFSTEKKSWDDARQMCLEQHGDLASINTAQQQAFIDNQLKCLNNDIKFWIGANDKANEGTFVWSDGSTMSYTNWAAGEPNDNTNEDCVEILTKTFQWNDQQCSDINGYICRKASA
uniref:Toxin candidate TRINITY_DN20653_c5_g3_i1.p1 n=1 Tax=Ceriantheomorphe brasiliensis TaxID=1048506 RepID=A0A7G7WYW5_9CNID|nr:toxin candidate TRINITY_DN20653_c5_g3_i1.p1 [Ceriantheomorphe brasiliensis]